jgi:hypothetical protein
MQIDRIIQDCINYAQDNIAVSVAVAVALLLLLYTRPKAVLTLFLVALGAAGVMEIFDMLNATGLSRVK